jgi:hypothetical protein
VDNQKTYLYENIRYVLENMGFQKLKHLLILLGFWDNFVIIFTGISSGLLRERVFETGQVRWLVDVIDTWE